MQVCTSLQTDNHARTPPLCFLQAGCPSCHPTNSVKALNAIHIRSYISNNKVTADYISSHISSYVSNDKTTADIKTLLALVREAQFGGGEFKEFSRTFNYLFLTQYSSDVLPCRRVYGSNQKLILA